MERKTTMVREYANAQAFKEDEQKLAQEGWFAEMTGNPDAKQGLISTLLARFTRTKPASFVVTYKREDNTPRRRG
jgi:hypothetical protein